MRTILTILLLFLIRFSAYSTAQIPDLIIIEGDTLELMSNPLEDYLEENENLKKYIDYYYTYCSACWRGYQALWKIENDKLYLVKIRECCYFPRYWITDKNIDTLKQSNIPSDIVKRLETMERKSYNFYEITEYLRKEFKKKYLKPYYQSIKQQIVDEPWVIPVKSDSLGNKMFAKWYSGSLRVPKGEMTSYVHMGYGSNYDTELFIEIEEGNVVDTNTYHYIEQKVPKEYGYLKTISYETFIPTELINNRINQLITVTDTLELVNKDSTKYINAFTKNYNSRLRKLDERVDYLKPQLDSIKSLLSDFEFKDYKTYDFNNYTVIYADGERQNEDSYIRIICASTMHTRAFLIYIDKAETRAKFIKNANFMTENLKLTEFGY